MDADVIIVGAGTIGLSAAYHASARKLNVVILDQNENVDNSVNSSKGLERIFRILYAEPARVRLVETAYAMWREVESYIGYPILDEDPLLFFGYPNSPTFEGSLNAIATSMNELGIPYDYYGSPNAISNAFPVFNANSMPSNYAGLRQNIGATILVDKSKQAFSELCAQSGRVATEYGQTVTNIQYDGSKYTVTTSENSYVATHIILAPGFWLNSVMPFFGLKAADAWKIWVMTLGYFNTNPAYRNDLPIWYEFGNADNGLFYGFPPTGESPVPGYPGAVKVSADFPGAITTDPIVAINSMPSNSIMSSISNRIDQLFGGPKQTISKIPIPGSEAVCSYSIAGDGDMVIGRIPKTPEVEDYWPNASVFCMASGRGFKFTPIWGRVLVDLAVDGKTSYQSDIEGFKPTRPNIFQSSTP